MWTFYDAASKQAHGYDPFVSFYYIIFLIVLFSC